MGLLMLPPYSLNLASLDLFPHMKKHSQCFDCQVDNETKGANIQVSEGSLRDIFKEVLEALQKNAEKCMAVDEHSMDE